MEKSTSNRLSYSTPMKSNINDEILTIHLLDLPCTSGHHKVVDEQDNGLAIARYGRKSVWKYSTLSL